MQKRPALMIPQLGESADAPFPDPESALRYPDGLLAWGGDLDPQRLRAAYHQGIFPWYCEDQPILWWCPARRAVLFPDAVHVSRRLARVLRQGRFRFTVNRAFEAVITGCAQPRGAQEGTWITADMHHAYLRLHRAGLAHSVEAWQGERLAGGLYGIAMGGVFFGESMFSARRDASKAVLVTLCQHMLRNGYALLDCQISNPHLAAMGAVEIARPRFLRLLRKHADRPAPSFPSLFAPEPSAVD
jgi:leucyl/phenylalanyl-tRNA--protein transferase